MTNSIEECQECGGEIVLTTSDYVCVQCGLVQARNYVDSSYSNTINSIREGTQSTGSGISPLNSTCLGSCIGYYNDWNFQSTKKNSALSYRNNLFFRLKKINDIYLNSNSNNKLYRGLKYLKAITGALDLPETIKFSSAKIFRSIYLKIKSCRTVDLVSASIYLALRSSEYQVKVGDLLNVIADQGFSVTGKKLLATSGKIRSMVNVRYKTVRAENYMEKVLELIKNNSLAKKVLTSKTIHMEDYLKTIRTISDAILKILTKQDRGGRNPYVLACAVVAGADLYFALCRNQKRGILTQRKIAAIGQVAEYTLREHFIYVIKPYLRELKVNQSS